MSAANIHVHLQPDHLRLTLGERATVEVEVFNASPVVDEYRVDFVGPAADPIHPEWVTASPRTVALFPNTSGVVALTLEVPAASQLLAGSHIVGIAVRSTTDSNAVHVAELPITVDAQPMVSLHLEPRMTSGGRKGYTEAVVRNLGNVAVAVRMHATDPAGKIRFEMDRPEALLPTDDELHIPIELRAGRPFVGSGATRPFVLTAEVEDRAMDVGAEARPGIETVRTEGSFSQAPWLSGRVLMAIGMLLPVAAILVAAWILRPQPEAVDLTGEMAFGVAGLVERVEAREGETTLAGSVLAALNLDEAAATLHDQQLALRRAILELAGLRSDRLVSEAEAALDDPEPPQTDEDAEYLAALAADLDQAVEESIQIRNSALIGLTNAFTVFCSGIDDEEREDEWPECANVQAPLPPEVGARIAQASAENPAAGAVLEANTHYRTTSATVLTLQALAEEASARAAEMQEAAAAPPPPPTEADEALAAALGAQQAQEDLDYELRVLEGRAAIADAQLACRDALDDVARTVLRAPVDVVVIEVHASSGARVDPDTPVITLERTDGREFVAPSVGRAPALQDIPEGIHCPGTLEELQAADIQRVEPIGSGDPLDNGERPEIETDDNIRPEDDGASDDEDSDDGVDD